MSEEGMEKGISVQTTGLISTLPETKLVLTR